MALFDKPFKSFKEAIGIGGDVAMTGSASDPAKQAKMKAEAKRRGDIQRTEFARKKTLKGKRKRELEAGGTLGQLLLDDQKRKEEEAGLLTSTTDKPSLLLG